MKVSLDKSSVAPSRRPIRSFVRRSGRVTKKQQHAMETLWSRYVVEPHTTGRLFDELHDQAVPIILEIGFGMGASLAQMAQMHPTSHFIGVEVHRPGVAALLASLAEAETNNVTVLCVDAVDWLNTWVEDGVFTQILVLFPDPWPKKRHHKRRLIQPEFVRLLTQKLKSAGALHCATDWQPYAQQMRSVLSNIPQLTNESPEEGYVSGEAFRPPTKFEARGRRLGHSIYDLRFTKAAKPAG